MKVFASIIKISSLACVTYLILQAIELWDSNDLALRTANVSVDSAPKTIEPLNLHRIKFSEHVVRDISSKNLFRQQRSPHEKPVLNKASTLPPPVIEESIPVPKHIIPAPRISLTGVVVIPGGNVAFLEGEYAANSWESRYVPLKTRQFILGDQIGEYRITEIERSHVMLKTLAGDSMQLKFAENNRYVSTGKKSTLQIPALTTEGKNKGRVTPNKLVEKKERENGEHPDSQVLYVKLMNIKTWPSNRPMPSTIYDDGELKSFLSANGIRSANDLKDAEKINQLKRAARKQLLLIKMRARASK